VLEQQVQMAKLSEREARTGFGWVGVVRRGQSPLDMILVVLTFVTGLVDAVTYLGFGHVFAANMTGNVIVLGFALVGAGQISATASVVSLAAFMVGSTLSARLARAFERTRDRWILSMLVAETALLTVAAVLSTRGEGFGSDHAIVALLAVAMGMRTATVRRLGISDVSTTVLTTTLAALATDIHLPGVTVRAVGLRLLAVAAMLLGAAFGAVLFGGGSAQVLGVAVSLVLILTISYVVVLLRKRTADE
jgi:uncharacterized membrane protein YoaK (UPF0700 family)